MFSTKKQKVLSSNSCLALKKIIKLAIILQLVISTQALWAQYANINDWQARAQIDNANHSLPYRLFIPKNYSASNQYPLLLVLHGATELGSNNTSQLDWVGNHMWGESSVQDTYPCIVAIPQCPNSVSFGWAGMDWTQVVHTQLSQPTWAMQCAIDMIDSLCREFSINTNRLYVTGVSMGGFGTWESITRWPDKFAAAIPMAGGGDTTKAYKITGIPIHCFHGGADGLVPVGNTRNMSAAIGHAGGSLCKYTEIAGGGHDGTTFMNAYTPAEVRWFFSQLKNSTGIKPVTHYQALSRKSQTVIIAGNQLAVMYSLKSTRQPERLYDFTGKLLRSRHDSVDDSRNFMNLK